jgi:hypothetical protein
VGRKVFGRTKGAFAPFEEALGGRGLHGRDVGASGGAAAAGQTAARPYPTQILGPSPRTTRRTDVFQHAGPLLARSPPGLDNRREVPPTCAKSRPKNSVQKPAGFFVSFETPHFSGPEEGGRPGGGVHSRVLCAEVHRTVHRTPLGIRGEVCGVESYVESLRLFST